MKKKYIAGLILFGLINISTIGVYANPQIEKAEEEIRIIDNQIETSINEIEKIEKEMFKTQIEIEQSKINIEKKSDDLNKNSILMKNRLAELYKANSGLMIGGPNVLEVLFNSDGILDLIKNINNVKTINDIDKKNKEQIENDKLLIEQNKIDILNKQDKLDLSLEKTKKEKETIETKKEEVVKNLNLLNMKSRGFSNDSLKYIEGLEKSDNEKVNKVVEEAKKYLGIPYVWGGTTPDGFDCSGLMQYIYRSVGVNLPRVSEQQQFFGTRIPFEQAQMGDMIFWGTPAHHVGLYLGNGLVLHAPRTGDVIKISPIWGEISSATRVI